MGTRWRWCPLVCTKVSWNIDDFIHVHVPPLRECHIERKCQQNRIHSARVKSIIKTQKMPLPVIVGRKSECLAPWLSHVHNIGSHTSLQRLLAQGIQPVRHSLPLAHYELLLILPEFYSVCSVSPNGIAEFECECDQLWPCPNILAYIVY